MRRWLLGALVVMSLSPVLVSCRADPRDQARQQFIEQLSAEGGLTTAQATCIVDGFFAHRTTDQLRAFFANQNLTDAERAEFATLAKACAVPNSTQTPATQH